MPAVQRRGPPRHPACGPRRPHGALRQAAARGCAGDARPAVCGRRIRDDALGARARSGAHPAGRWRRRELAAGRAKCVPDSRIAQMPRRAAAAETRTASPRSASERGG
eukprot:101616-Prymnesium_polylepis.1